MACNRLSEFLTQPSDVLLEPFMDHMWHFECLLTSPRPSQQMCLLEDRRHPTEAKFQPIKPGKMSRKAERDFDGSESFHFCHDQKPPRSCAGRNSSNIIAGHSDNPFRTYQKDSPYPCFATAELRTVFGTFDENGDGRLTADEIRASMAKLGLEMTEKELTSTVAAIDKNGDGFVDPEEFFSFYSMNSVDEVAQFGGKEDKENLKRAFHVFDKNKDGYITAQELHAVLVSISSSQESKLEDCRKMIRGADLDGDGKVDFLEFQLMMSKKSPNCSVESRKILRKSRSVDYVLSS